MVILIYLTISFRKSPHPVRFGVAAIIAMLHDVLLVIGLASILGVTIGLQVDALFLTAVLTVLSFSVHDTIVVFDRVRENLALRRSNQSLRGCGQPLGGPDPDPLDQHAADVVPDTAGAVALRRPDDPAFHPDPADRADLRHLLLDLQRRPDPGGLGEWLDARLAHCAPACARYRRTGVVSHDRARCNRTGRGFVFAA